MILFLYALLNFISATLIFFIQPLAAKTVLPILGGAPYVWNGCMVFFQAILLLGYIYAHVLNTYASTKRNVMVHLGLFALAGFLVLPLDISGLVIGGAESANPLLWLSSSLFLVLGLPFFILSATSPLTQSWFARTSSKWRDRPYMLYSASNLGSFAGLLAYPFLFEPYFNIKIQASFIDFGFVALFALLAVCGVYMLKHQRKNEVAEPVIDEKISIAKKLRWIFLALVPSGLLYAVTMHVATNIASFPLLWVIPLGLYILSFVLVFSERGKFFSESKILHFAFAMALLIQMAVYNTATSSMVPVIFLMLFGFCMVCHGKLYNERPLQNRNLTKFYIYTSLGGVLGGLFNTFIAPHIFSNVTELPLLVVLSLAVWVSKDELTLKALSKAGIKPLLAMIATLLVVVVIKKLDLISNFPDGTRANIISALTASLVIFAILLTVFNIRNSLVAVLITAAFFVPARMISLNSLPGKVVYQERNMFGINRVTENDEKIRSFLHGNTVHGIQDLDAPNPLAATSYYYPLKQVFAHIDNKLPIAAIGQGVGTVACYAKPGQQMDFYEIDALVSQIAEKYFTYMTSCPGERKLIIGDGRINIAKQPDAKYGVIILDAFSSDSIPVHLITREAMQVYGSKIDDNGIILANISNRYLHLSPVLSTVAKSLGYSILVLNYAPVDSEEFRLVSNSVWVAIAKNEAILEPIANNGQGWEKLNISEVKYLWRDDYSNIIRSIIW